MTTGPFALLWQMGWFAWAIIAVLFVMSVAVLGVVLTKGWRLRTSYLVTRRFSPEFARALEEDRLGDATALIAQYPESHVAQVLGEAIRGVVPLLDDPALSALAVDTAERAIEREQILLAAELKKGLGSLATIGATAPLLGLLGTVIGITNSFLGMAQNQGGGIEAVAAGIGEALITTAVGLVVAIPAVWSFNFFMNRLELLFSELAYAGRELVDWLIIRTRKRAREVTSGDGA